MAKDLGYGLKKVLSAKTAGCEPASEASKENEFSDLRERSDTLLMLRFQLVHLEQVHQHYSGTKVFHEDVKRGQT